MLKIIFFPFTIAWWIVKTLFKVLNFLLGGIIKDIANIKIEKN